MDRTASLTRAAHRRVVAPRQDGGPERSSPWWPASCFYLVTLLAAGALGAVQPWTGLPEEVLQLTQFGPALAVIVVVLAFPDLRGLVARSCGGGLAPTLRQVGLVSATAAGVFACSLATWSALGQVPPVRSPASLVAPLALVAPAQLLGACAEEVGWRCLLQPLLRRRVPTLATSVVVGLLWGAWHVQVFTAGAGFASAFLVATVAMSLVLGLAVERSEVSALATAGVFHLLVNLGLLFLMGEESGDATSLWVFAGGCSLAAAAWVVLDRVLRPRRAPGA